MLINLTPNAVQEAKRILTKDGNALRVGIEGGGCSGFSYKLSAVDLEDNYNEKEDSILEFDELKVIVDRKSALYLEETTLDFISTDLMSGFSFENPNSVKSCGCGQSFGV